jgi:hypothetical protein
MSNNAAPSRRESSVNSSTRADETLPSGSRLTLEGIKSLALEISQGAEGEIKSKADEIVREIDGLIEQVISRETKIYEWASGQ